jgi:small multidrug resistance pump
MSPRMVTYGALLAAIVCEVIATSLLQKTQQFTKLVPTLLMVLFYVLSFYCLSHAIRTIPVGVAYALWSALGIVLISAVGFFLFKQSLDLPALIGIGFIVAGVVIINLFSKTMAH